MPESAPGGVSTQDLLLIIGELTVQVRLLSARLAAVPPPPDEAAPD